MMLRFRLRRDVFSDRPDWLRMGQVYDGVVDEATNQKLHPDVILHGPEDARFRIPIDYLERVRTDG